ncbi:MAG: hypothetical protein P8J50_18815 [Acidimicrobiales bacterium]|nr:hypothetical protein [Acidimicrobiales bacterium]
MPYSAADESFTHQYSRPFDEVHHPHGSWSDRCYFFAHSPNGDVLLTNGYGNNPNQRRAHGYGKVALADGRHWDLSGVRGVTGADRDLLAAGPMTWTCVEALKHWHLKLPANGSGVSWDMHYEPRAPMWELLPMEVDVDGRTILDMYHMKESGQWRGWYEIEGERTSIDGWPGGRDRTFGVRVADEIDWWLWLDIGFEDRAIQAWLIESHDGTVQYVDGGVTYTDGTVSPKRFVRIDHEVEFDGDRKRPARVVLDFTDEDGTSHRVTGDAPHQNVAVYYGQPLKGFTLEKMGAGEVFLHFPWNSTDSAELAAIESQAMSIDQLMRFEMNGDDSTTMVGHGIFEILSGGEGHSRYPNWPKMDMSKFRQHATE